MEEEERAYFYLFSYYYGREEEGSRYLDVEVSSKTFILWLLPAIYRALTTMIGGESFTLKHCSSTFSVWQRAPFCGGSDSLFVLFQSYTALHVVQLLDSLLLSTSPSSIQVVFVMNTPAMVPCFVMLHHVLSCSALSCPALTLLYLAVLCYAFPYHCCSPHCQPCASALSFFSQYPFVSIVVLILQTLPTLHRALTTMIGGESFALKYCSNTFSVQQQAPFCSGSNSFFVLF